MFTFWELTQPIDQINANVSQDFLQGPLKSIKTYGDTCWLKFIIVLFCKIYIFAVLGAHEAFLSHSDTQLHYCVSLRCLVGSDQMEESFRSRANRRLHFENCLLPLHFVSGRGSCPHSPAGAQHWMCSRRPSLASSQRKT